MSISPAKPPLSPFKKVGYRWEVNDDEAQTCRYEVLKYKHMKRHDYFPGIESMEVPACYATFLTKEEWVEKISALNKAIVEWWSPGNRVRNLSYVMGTVCLLVPCLLVYASMDEVGYCCFVNRKRKQLRDLLEPICEGLCDSRLLWTVEYRRRGSDTSRGPDNQQAENSKAIYIVVCRADVTPVKPEEMTREEGTAVDRHPKFRPQTPPDTVRVSEDGESEVDGAEAEANANAISPKVASGNGKLFSKHVIVPEPVDVCGSITPRPPSATVNSANRDVDETDKVMATKLGTPLELYPASAAPKALGDTSSIQQQAASIEQSDSGGIATDQDSGADVGGVLSALETIVLRGKSPGDAQLAGAAATDSNEALTPWSAEIAYTPIVEVEAQEEILHPDGEEHNILSLLEGMLDNPPASVQTSGIEPAEVSSDVDIEASVHIAESSQVTVQPAQTHDNDNAIEWERKVSPELSIHGDDHYEPTPLPLDGHGSESFAFLDTLMSSDSVAIHSDSLFGIEDMVEDTKPAGESEEYLDLDKLLEEYEAQKFSPANDPTDAAVEEHHISHNSHISEEAELHIAVVADGQAGAIYEHAYEDEDILSEVQRFEENALSNNTEESVDLDRLFADDEEGDKNESSTSLVSLHRNSDGPTSNAVLLVEAADTTEQVTIDLLEELHQLQEWKAQKTPKKKKSKGSSSSDHGAAGPSQLAELESDMAYFNYLERDNTFDYSVGKSLAARQFEPMTKLDSPIKEEVSFDDNDLSDLLGSDWQGAAAPSSDIERPVRSKTESSESPTPSRDSKSVLPEEATPLAQWSQRDNNAHLRNDEDEVDFSDWLNDIDTMLSGGVSEKDSAVSPAQHVVRAAPVAVAVDGGSNHTPWHNATKRNPNTQMTPIL